MTYSFPFEKAVILENDWVRLEPLSLDHAQALSAHAFEPDLWKWTVDTIDTIEKLRSYINQALNERRNSQSYPFAIFDKKKNESIGCTRYGAISSEHQRVQIGWTWISAQCHGTPVNAACKYELLRFIFEDLNYRRVEFAVDAINVRSRKAIEKLGAQQEGTLRSHMVTHGGRIRDTVYYSLLNNEWPATKAGLLEKISGQSR